MSDVSSSSDSSSDDDIFTRRVEFPQHYGGARSSSSGTTTSGSSAAVDTAMNMPKSGLPLAAAVVGPPVAEAATTTEPRSPLLRVDTMVLTEGATTELALRSPSSESAENISPGGSLAEQRPRHSITGTRPPANKDSVGSTIRLEGALTPQRGHPSSISASESRLERPRPRCSSSQKRRTSWHSIKTRDLGVAAPALTSSTLSKPPCIGSGGRRGKRVRRRNPKSGDAASLRAVWSFSASPRARSVNVRLLSDEAYIDMFRIPALIAQLSLSLMAAKPIDPRAFARDWLADRLVSEEDEGDDSTIDEGGSMKSGSGVRERESQVLPSGTPVLARSTELPSSSSLAFQGSGSTLGDLASNNGATRSLSVEASCRRGRSERFSHQHCRTAISGADEAGDGIKAVPAAALDHQGDKASTVIGRTASVGRAPRTSLSLHLSRYSSSTSGPNALRKQKALDRQEQRRAQKSITALTTPYKRSSRRIGDASRPRKHKASAAMGSTSESATGSSARRALLSTTLTPPLAEASKHDDARALQRSSSGSMQRSEKIKRRTVAAALRSRSPTPEASSPSSSSSSLSAFSSPGSDGVEWASVALRSRRTTVAGSPTSADIDPPLSRRRTTMKGESSKSAEALSAPHETTRGGQKIYKSSHSPRIVEAVATATPTSAAAAAGQAGIHKSGDSAGDRSSGDKGAFTSPLQRDLTAVPSVASETISVSVARLPGANVHDNPSVAVQQQQCNESGPAAVPFDAAAKRSVAKEELARNGREADEIRHADSYSSNVVARNAESASGEVREREKDAASTAAAAAAEAGRNDADNSGVGLAMFAPILGVDATTNEVIDYREVAGAQLSPSAFSAASGGAGALPPTGAASAGGVGGGHLSQTHASAAATPSSGLPPYTTRPVSSTFNVLPTPMLADFVGVGGLTNTSFSRRGVPNSSFGRRPAYMASAASRYADPAAGTATGGSSPPSLFITPHAPIDLPVHSGNDGVVDGETTASLQLVGFPKLNANFTAGPVESGAGLRTSDSALVRETTPMSARKTMQDDDLADAKTVLPSAFSQSAALQGSTDGTRNSTLSLAKDTLGPVATAPATPSPLSATMKLESARRLGKLLDQLPAAKYAAAIVFLEGLLNSSGGSSDAAETPESASISMMATIGDASSRSRGLLNMTSTVTDATLGGLGLSDEGLSPLIGLHTAGRPWSGTLGREQSPTARASSFAHLATSGSGQAATAAASGVNEDALGVVGGVSRVPEDGQPKSFSKAGSASVEALVRDALSQSVLRSLPSTHEEVAGSASSLPLRADVAGWASYDGTSVDMRCVSSSSRLESAHGERFTNTVTCAARASQSRASSPLVVAPGAGGESLLPQLPPSQSQRSNLSAKPLSGTDLSSMRRQTSSPQPTSDDALTAAAHQRPKQPQPEQQPIVTEMTEHRSCSDGATTLRRSFSGPVSSLPAGNMSLAPRDTSVHERQTKEAAAPTDLGAGPRADPGEPTAPEHSTTRTATAADGVEANSSKEDADLLTSSHQSLTSHVGNRIIADRLVATEAAAETPESCTTGSPKALGGTHQQRRNEDRGDSPLLKQHGTNCGGDESVGIHAPQRSLYLQGGTHQQLSPFGEAENPMSLPRQSVKSALLLSADALAGSPSPGEPLLPGSTEAIANPASVGAVSEHVDRYSRDCHGRQRRHSRSASDGCAANAPGHSTETFEGSQASDSDAAATARERSRGSQGLGSSDAKSSAVPAQGGGGVVRSGSNASDSPSLPLRAQHPSCVGGELELDDVDLGATLKMAVVLAAAAGTQSVPAVYRAHSNEKGCMSGCAISSSISGQSAGAAFASGSGVEATESFASMDPNEQISDHAPASESCFGDHLAAHSSRSPAALHGIRNHTPQGRVEGSGAGVDRALLPSSHTVTWSHSHSDSVAAGDGVPVGVASTTPPATATVGVSEDETFLDTPITAMATPLTLEASTPSPPLVTSSVAAAMNSFFSREDHVAPEELEVVREVVALYDAFAALDETQLEALVRTMTRTELPRGATVVCEGDRTLGQLLLIVSGRVAISRKGIVTRTLARGQFYGEMEMSYHVEHSRVTLTAATPTVVLYALNKVDYQKLVIHEKDARRYMFLQYVNECVLFKGLSPHIKMRLADSLRVRRLRQGAKLTEQGAPVEWMYLIMSGNVRMTYRAPPDFSGETNDLLVSKRCAASQDDVRHMATTSCSVSNFAGSTFSEGLMSSVASAAAASTVAGTSMTRCGTVPGGHNVSRSSSLTPLATTPQIPSSTVLFSQTAVTSSATGAPQQELPGEAAAFSGEACKGSPSISVVSPSSSAIAAIQRPPQLLPSLSAKGAYGNNQGRSGDHPEEQGANDGLPQPYSLHSRRRRVKKHQDHSTRGWQGSPRHFTSSGGSLDTYGNRPPSPLSVPASLQQSANPLLDTAIHPQTASTPATSLANTAATRAGAAGCNDTVASGSAHSNTISGSNTVVVVVDRSKGQLVGETEFVFKCKGLFTAVATTPVQAARISRLHFEAIMTRPVVEEMKRSMLLNPDYYFFELTVPEELKEDMRRMLLRLNVGPAARRRHRLAQKQLPRHSVTGAGGMMSDSRSRGGAAGEKRDSKGCSRHLEHKTVSSRCAPHGHTHTPLMGSIAGRGGGSTHGPNATNCSSGSNSHSTSPALAVMCAQDGRRERDDGHHSQTGSGWLHDGRRHFRATLLEPSPTMARSSTNKAIAGSYDAATMEFSTSRYLAAPTVCDGPLINLAVANTAGVSAKGASEDAMSVTPLPATIRGDVDGAKERDSCSDGSRNRYSRATARLTTAGWRTSFTKHSSSTASRRRHVSTRGEIVFSGSRNLYRFSAEAMSINESIMIAVVVDGTIIRWNSVAQSVTGYAPFEAIGRSIFDFIVSDDGRQHMRDTLAVAARFAGRWEQYSLQGLKEQRVFPFRQNTGLYQVGLELSVIPSNYAKTAEVLLLIGREGKYRAASTYAADVAKWLEGSLKPQLRQFQRRMAQIESHGWQLTAEDALQVRGNLDACMSMVEQFTKFSLLNMEVVSQSWRPVRIPALLRRFALEAMAFARQQQHEYYCNIDLVEPKVEVFLDAPQVLAILRLLLSDALQCPNVDDNGNVIVAHAELRVTVVEPQNTNQVPLNIGSPAGRVSGSSSGLGRPTGLFAPSSSLPMAPSDNHSGSAAAADGPRHTVASASTVAKSSYPVIYTPVSAVESSSDATPLAPASASLLPEMAAKSEHAQPRPLPRGRPQQQHLKKFHQPHGSETARSDHSHDSPLMTLVSESTGGTAQGGEVDSSPTFAAAGPAPGSTLSSATGVRGFTRATIPHTLAATLRRIRFELRDDGPTIRSLRDRDARASEGRRGDTLSESMSADDTAAENSTFLKSTSHISEQVFGEDVGGGGGHNTGLDASSKSFTFTAASARRGAELEQVEKILASLGGVVYGFTRPEAAGNVVRVELPLLAVPGSTDDGRDDENGGNGGGAAAPPSSATRTFTVIVADSNRLHQQQLCRVLWARQHAVVPVTSFRDLGRKLEMNTADILLIDPLHIDIVSEDYESLLGDDPFDDIRILSARLALVVMASDFSDWRVQKLLNRHAVVELPKVGSGALVHIAMQEAEQLVSEMRDEEERLDLIRRTFTNSSTERHKIGKRIGKGAFGDVFEVEDTLTGGKMAMKRMRLHDGLMADEVVQEILAMTTLTHENIIQYFYCEKESDTLLRLYMELAPGGTLRDKIRELPGVPLPFAEIVHHLSCICHGLAYVHEQCYVHGDLKTANLLLGTRNRTKIGDFGTAKHLAPHQLLYTMVGTPQYMAPEVLTADVEQRLGYDFKADIWSLGCIVLEMATGSPPFAHVECAQGMGIIKYLTELTDTPDLSPLFSGNPLVYEFVKSCLDLDPQSRPTAQELLHFDIFAGAVASQRAERLVRRAEMLYKLNKYAAMRANGGRVGIERNTVDGNGGRCTTPRNRGHYGSDDSEEGEEGDDGNHSSLSDSGLLFSSDDSTAYEDYDDDDVDDEEANDDELSERDSVENAIEDDCVPRAQQEH
ncbi:hypothetical protein CUR178_05847 [Leishmania enriettii]|uniref:non-specific serine/threonine protein kinase n=1 Tax=Leishmania enriettii TaxID=5663 RepID=A0A836KPI0_LEIEN|nr:hypothetical protein CUR178_05847 [Leishmania enriettii]